MKITIMRTLVDFIGTIFYQSVEGTNNLINYVT